MAIVHADNFSIYGTDETLLTEGVYAQCTTATASLVTDPDGLSGGFVMFMTTSSSDVGLRYVLATPVATLGIAARLYMAALPTVATAAGGRSPVLQVRDGSNNILYRLWVSTTGVLTVSNSAGTTIAASTGPVLAAGSWFHIEWKSIMSATVGAFEVRVEGTVVINSTGLNTGATNIAQIWIGNSGGGSGTSLAYWKDLVVWDSTGSSNNTFLGSVLVTTLTPTSDAALNWASTGANGFSVLDNIPPSDAAYISAATPPPSAYKGGLSDLPTTVTSVKALVTYVRAAKTDGGDGSLQVGVISDPAGTPATSLGADRPITTSQAYWKDIFELDPKTSAAWLPPAVNLAQIQINRTT